MAVVIDNQTTKYKLIGSGASKTFTVDPDYFNDTDAAEDLTKDIEKIYDTDVTITGFAGIIEVKYSIAS